MIEVASAIVSIAQIKLDSLHYAAVLLSRLAQSCSFPYEGVFDLKHLIALCLQSLETWSARREGYPHTTECPI